MTQQSDISRKLLDNGYEPLVADGKRAVESGWQEAPITLERLAATEVACPGAKNIGLRTGCLVGVDIDVTDRAHAMEIEKIASAGLGETLLRRVGSKGCLLCYRNASPIGKITIGAGNRPLVEILGAGQQFIAFGPHPVTGKDYEWSNDFLGGDPLETPFGDLPEVTPDKLHAMAHAVAARLAGLGYGDVTVKGIKTTKEAVTSAATGKPVTPALVEAMLACVDPASTRDVWLTACGGLVTAPVADAAWDGLDFFVRWSRGDFHGCIVPANYQGPGDCEAQWARDVELRASGHDVPTFGALVNLARAGGYDGASEAAADRFKDFLATLPPQPNEKREAPRDHVGQGLLPSYMGGEISKITPPSWLIDKFIPTPAVGIYFGKFGTFKTTTELDTVDAVLNGTKAFGAFDADKGDVVIVAGEGLSGLKTRIEARARDHCLTLDQYRLLLVAKVPKADRPEEWAALAETIRARGLKPKLIGIDHLSIMLSGQDQNDAAVATQAMQMAHELSGLFQCTVIILAHAGKDGDREVRGSSAFLDNVDFAYELTRAEGGDIVKVRCAKMRDGEAPEPFFLKAQTRHGAAIMVAADKDEARRASGKQVGLRVAEVAAALVAMAACPDGANAWNGKTGGISTRALAAELARLRHTTDGDSLAASPQEIASLVTILNRDGRQGGQFDALVVKQDGHGRQWAIAPGPIGREQDHV